MHNGILTLKGVHGTIRIACRIPEDMMDLPMARGKVVCIIASKHIALVPIVLDGDVKSTS
jgi:hypothetical protein